MKKLMYVVVGSAVHCSDMRCISRWCSRLAVIHSLVCFQHRRFLGCSRWLLSLLKLSIQWTGMNNAVLIDDFVWLYFADAMELVAFSPKGIRQMSFESEARAVTKRAH